MALDIDGYAVLAAIATVPEVFAEIRPDIARTARALVVKQLKHRALPLARLRLIRRTLGTETFALILDGMTDAEVKAVVARLDRHNATLRTASAAWHRTWLEGLANADEPAEAPKGTRARTAAKKPVAERALGKRPFAATWDGKDRDASAAKGKKKKKD
ncbi:hypothetical protein HCU64_11195 [Methylobacterium sp. C25]|uniref:hypothetical protein n=1 Tax=Methylobacterium sp. C25 TaxID=2721622 RepID=UPI001F46606C|nr:hypothetical protein [Methylobacterium sp. C25]MCE4224318.1 hypothetical protein [Methylobacterium sp. C25]